MNLKKGEELRAVAFSGWGGVKSGDLLWLGEELRAMTFSGYGAFLAASTGSPFSRG